MNYCDLYSKPGKYYDSEIFFVDQDCKIPYTGRMQEYSYDGKRLESESDIVNGLQDGMKIDYYDTGELEQICEMRDGTAWGLCFGFHKSGKLSSISLVFNTVFFDIYDYDESGCQKTDLCFSGDDQWNGISYTTIKDKVLALRKEYNMEQLNREVLEFGKPLSYGTALYEEALKSRVQ